MAYTIKPKSIEYLGVTFRSKLEAQCYDYLLQNYPSYRGYLIEYEPDVYRSLWPCDFAIYKNDHLTHIVEVKPRPEMFDVMKYIISSNQMIEYPSVFCMLPTHIVEFFPDGGFKIIPHNQKEWFQSYNNINYGGLD